MENLIVTKSNFPLPGGKQFLTSGEEFLSQKSLFNKKILRSGENFLKRRRFFVTWQRR